MIERFERFSFFLSELSRYWHKIAAEEMAEYGLKGPYSVYFTVLYRYPEGLTAVQLGELCSRDKADVSRAVALLEKKGFIRRQGNGEQQYRARLQLTESGRQLADGINRKAKAAVEYGGMGLTDEQRDILYFSLERITANLQAMSRGGLSTSQDVYERSIP